MHEIKAYIQIIYCHTFEMRVLLVTNTTYKNLKESHFTYMAVIGEDSNVYQGLHSSAMLSWMFTPGVYSFLDVIGQ